MLSHCIFISEFNLNSIESKNFFHQRSFLIAFDIVNNSASIELVVTVFCFEIFQSIISLKKRKDDYTY